MGYHLFKAEIFPSELVHCWFWWDWFNEATHQYYILIIYILHTYSSSSSYYYTYIYKIYYNLHIIYILYTYYIHIIYTYYIHILYTYYIHIYILYTYYIHIIYTYYIHIIYILYIYIYYIHTYYYNTYIDNIHIIYILSTYYIHIIYILYIYIDLCVYIYIYVQYTYYMCIHILWENCSLSAFRHWPRPGEWEDGKQHGKGILEAAWGPNRNGLNGNIYWDPIFKWLPIGSLIKWLKGDTPLTEKSETQQKSENSQDVIFLKQGGISLQSDTKSNQPTSAQFVPFQELDFSPNLWIQWTSEMMTKRPRVCLKS